jgi:hypothetical protein
MLTSNADAIPKRRPKADLLPSQEVFRRRIRVGPLLARLHDIAFGKAKSPPALLSVQVKAAQILLAKVLPDLQLITHDGNAWTGVVRHVIELQHAGEPQHFIAHQQSEPIDIEHRIATDDDDNGDA